MTRSSLRTAGLAAAVLMAVGGLGTWASATVFGTTVSVNGADRDGAIVIICAVIVAMAVAVASRAMMIVGVIAALAASATSVYDWQDVQSKAGVSVGWGLWLAAIGSIAAIVVTVGLLRDRRVTGRA